MARIKTPDYRTPNAGNVPAELYDGDSMAWHDPAEFRAWIDKHTAGADEATLTALWRRYSGCHRRHITGVAKWAMATGLVDPRCPDQFDRQAIDRLGLWAAFGSLERARRSVCPTCRRLGLPVWADHRND